MYRAVKQTRDVWKWSCHGNYVGPVEIVMPWQLCRTIGPLTFHSQEILWLFMLLWCLEWAEFLLSDELKLSRRENKLTFNFVFSIFSSDMPRREDLFLTDPTRKISAVFILFFLFFLQNGGKTSVGIRCPKNILYMPFGQGTPYLNILRYLKSEFGHNFGTL